MSNKIRIVFESETKNIGYVLDPVKSSCTSGTFDKDCLSIEEISQEGVIDNPEEICRQIYYVLLAGLKNG